MIKIINVTGLKPEQIEQIQSIIEAFKAKNQLDNLTNSQMSKKIPYIMDTLTENPIQVNGFLTRKEIYER
ncbi:MAG TPA: hypothetical protein IGS52_19370 [Oscillatoriaceae cyanobacterium M33_DOE_052]|uniref:Uncharacterized protein n=1 Tax=Planktothricoides sp. SpSt-374 TaxID=2282167 RepID=A0A7C3ZLL9_9CYAN|nr:hypothetical protein [Oscillatoriaceae cyanobacterium M33_DOE_052]